MQKQFLTPAFAAPLLHNEPRLLTMSAIKNVGIDVSSCAQEINFNFESRNLLNLYNLGGDSFYYSPGKNGQIRFNTNIVSKFDFLSAF